MSKPMTMLEAAQEFHDRCVELGEQLNAALTPVIEAWAAAAEDFSARWKRAIAKVSGR